MRLASEASSIRLIIENHEMSDYNINYPPFGKSQTQDEIALFLSKLFVFQTRNFDSSHPSRLV